MSKLLGKRQTELVKSLKRRRLFGENGSDVADVHAGIAVNEKIFEYRQRAANMPDSHEGQMRVIREVEADEKQMRDAFRRAGVDEEDLPDESRTLKRLNIEERQRGNKTHWRDKTVSIPFYSNPRGNGLKH